MKRWTTAEDARLRKMHATRTNEEIAAALRRTVGSVRSRCWTLKLAEKAPPWTALDIAAVRSAYAKPPPLKLDELAARLGRDKTNVCRKARALGLTDPRRQMVAVRKVPPPRRFGSMEELRAFQSDHMRGVMRRYVAEHGHARGALGLRHTPEARARIGAASKAAWRRPSGLTSPAASQRRSDLLVGRIASGQMRSGYTRCAGGRRTDLGNIYFRSSWEANYARSLNLLIRQRKVTSWQYEPRTFVFDAIKRGTRSYTPDFLVVFPDGRSEWHEVKGWMDPPSKTRLARMARYYPAETVVVIGSDWFKQATRGGLAGIVPGWERRGVINKGKD